MRVDWTDRALRDVERLDRRTRERIVTAVERYAETGHGDVRHLEGPPLEGADFRLRVGDWRVLFTFQDGALVLLVVRVHPRSRAYRRRR
jgi:mRNA interferase RelE/StbE